MLHLVSQLRRARRNGSAANARSSSTAWFRCVNTTRGTVLAERVAWATGEARKRGLLGHDRLDPSEGMYIVPTQWIHTIGMRFAIDIAFLGTDGRVLSVHRGLEPNRLSRLAFRAEGALELAAGILQATRTEPGDVVQFEDLDP